MKCPNDGEEMEVGFLEMGNWISGKQPAMNKLGFVVGRKRDWVTAWKCNICGKVELQVKI